MVSASSTEPYPGVSMMVRLSRSSAIRRAGDGTVDAWYSSKAKGVGSIAMDDAFDGGFGSAAYISGILSNSCMSDVYGWE